MKKNTRRQKYSQNPAGPKGRSRYAAKVVARRRFAARFGLADAPWPVLLNENGEDAQEGPSPAPLLICGHPMTAIIVSGGGTQYCGECAKEGRGNDGKKVGVDF